jgi:hypothetical protein
MQPLKELTLEWTPKETCKASYFCCCFKRKKSKPVTGSVTFSYDPSFDKTKHKTFKKDFDVSSFTAFIETTAKTFGEGNRFVRKIDIKDIKELFSTAAILKAFPHLAELTTSKSQVVFDHDDRTETRIVSSS